MSRIKNKITNYLFIASLILAEIGWMFVKVNYISNIRSILIYIAIVLLIICCLVQANKYKAKTVFVIALLIAIFLPSAIISNNTTLLLLLLFCLAGRSIDFKRVVSLNWKILSILIIVVLLCYFFGWTDVYIMYRADGTMRSSMGFSHPNAFGAYLFAVFCQFLYSNYNKIKYWHCAVIGFVLALITAVFSDSRGSILSFIIIIVFFGVMKLSKNKDNLRRVVKKCLIIGPMILMALSLIVASSYNPSNKIMYDLNNLLTTRISSANYIIKNYTVKPFGQELDLVSTETAQKTGKKALVLDNSYVKLVYQYGAIAAFAFVVLYCLAISYAIKKKQWMLLIMLVAFSIRGLSGNIMFNLYGNIFLLSFSNIIYGERKDDM